MPSFFSLHVNNNLSKYNFNLGDTTANNHKNIDRIATFSGGTWINKNYNADFGGQWCFVDSFLIDDNGPYAIQRIMSAQTNTVLATRYCEKNVWGDWNIGVTKSDLPKYDIKTFTVNVTTQNANSNGKYYTEKKLSTESWYSSAKAIVPLFARKSGGAYICMAEIEYETLRVQADIAISGVTVGILVVS